MKNETNFRQVESSNYWQLTVARMERIDPHFGRCIADYCQNHRPEPELMKSIYQSLTRKTAQNTATENAAIMMVRNLQQNHQYYRHNALPKIGQSFAQILEHQKASLNLNLCARLFDLFATALIVHINEEEQVFESLMASHADTAAAEYLFSEDHSDETEALDQIIELLDTCAERNHFDPCSILLTQLRNLSNDLKIHTFVEEQLLVPALKYNSPNQHSKN